MKHIHQRSLWLSAVLPIAATAIAASASSVIASNHAYNAQTSVANRLEKPNLQTEKTPLSGLTQLASPIPTPPSQTPPGQTHLGPLSEEQEPRQEELSLEVSNDPDPISSSTQAEDLLVALPDSTADGETATAQVEDRHEDSDLLAQEDAAADSEDYSLREQSQNPVANLISLPFQNNTNFGVGQFDRTQNILNIQPVVPTPLSDDLLLVSRVIVPLVYQPELAPGVGEVVGLGDINPTFFFVPNGSPSNVTWGVGPTFLLPTATDTTTGAGKWAAGPAAVAVVTTETLVFGGLVSHVWSFAGDPNRTDVSQFLVQPFVNYNLPNGWFLTSAPIITANWEAAAGDQWTVPIGGGFGRVFAIDNQPVSASLQAYWNAATPTNGPEWSIRASLTLLFPTR